MSSSLKLTWKGQSQRTVRRRPPLPEKIRVLPPFTVNERVLVFSHQRLYDAKILKAELFEQKWWRFYITYMVKNPSERQEKSPRKEKAATSRKIANRANVRNRRVIHNVSYKETNEEGWSEWPGWKQWVGATRIVARTRMNVIKMEEIQSAVGISWSVERPQKEEGVIDPINKVWGEMQRELGVTIPSSLLMQWIEDEDLSLHIGQIVHTPAINVHDLLENFEDTNSGVGVNINVRDKFLRQFDNLFLRGIDAKGNWHVICQLLYKTEQYGYLDKLQNVDPSKTLGAEHLLRIMVTLRDFPDIMRMIQKSGTYLQRLFNYLEDNQHWFVSTRGIKKPRTSKAAHLLYTNDGGGLLALGSNGIQKLWMWERNEQNPSGKANANQLPLHCHKTNNDISGADLKNVIPCMALSTNGCDVISSAGGKVSLFNMATFKVMKAFMPSPPASTTYLAFDPRDTNVIAIGREDSTIMIYDVQANKVKSKLKGHKKRLTGLAFSTKLNILVSSGADARLCVWSVDSWKQKETRQIQLPGGKSLSNGDTRVEFHRDAVLLLVSHASQLAIYDASKMDRIHQWVSSAPISSAALSCNSRLVFASFNDGNVGIFDTDTLTLSCRVTPSGYLSQSISKGNRVVVAAHPQDPNQFAIGLSDGSVIVLEPVHPPD